ncbi:MAG: hypothetical protein ACKPKO_29465, partial [Candidatus Fonsibacter sp.]
LSLALPLVTSLPFGLGLSLTLEGFTLALPLAPICLSGWGNDGSHYMSLQIYMLDGGCVKVEMVDICNFTTQYGWTCWWES